jgi:dihydroorotate dehydrogenase|tara:strand:+ start:6979 stop:7683 length:705 start_codon:yes stop_codon:yes gene_type:complete
MLFISPPFGNYISLPHTKSIKGSYTLEPRTGLIQQILKTFRYSFKYNGWVNKIGLRNKGLQYGIKHYNHDKDIISIAILNEKEIPKILQMLPNETNIELNISCPNVNKSLAHNKLSQFINPQRDWCIIKLSPTVDMNLVDNYYKQGFRQFHCSNTIPVKEGGLSGSAIIPYNFKLINVIKNKYSDCEIISGGGIYNWEIRNKYKNIGADHFSISTIFLKPINLSLFFAEFYWNL